MTDLNAAIHISAIDNASSVLRNLGSSVSNAFSALPGPVKAVAGGLAVVGGVAVAVGAKSVQMAADFQSGMTSLVTGAGESQKSLKLVSDGILDISTSTGTSTKALTDGMYMIESAGLHGADGLNVLKTAAQGAKVGNADLGVVSNALTTILTDYHLKSTQSTGAMNALITTVASGKTHMQDLASSMGSVLPLASSLGISFPQVGGAIATMTNAGMPAQQAAQNLANTMRALAAPNAIAEKSMQAVGISAQDLKDTLTSKGLPAAIKLVEDHVGKTFPAGSVEAVQAFKHIMGGATGYNTALMLGGKNADTFKNNVGGIAKALNSGGGAVQGWSEVQKDFNQQMSQGKAAIDALMIKIGTALLPVVGKLAAQIAPLIARFSDWITKHHVLEGVASILQGVLGGLVTGISTLAGWIGNIVGFFQRHSTAADALKAALAGLAIGVGVWIATLIPALVVSFLAWAAAAGAAAIATLTAAAPFILIGLIVAAVVFGIIMAVKHWGAITDWLKGVWSAFSSWWSGAINAIGNFFQNIWNGIVNFFKQNWDKILNILKIAGIAILTIMTGGLALVVIAVATHWDQIIGFFKNAWSAISGALGNLWNGIHDFFGNLVGKMVDFGKNLIQGFINGIKNMAGAVGNAVSGIAGQVKDFLGFHSPTKEGPGSEAHLWGPALVKMFANDIASGTPKARAAAEQMMSGVEQAIKSHQVQIAMAHVSGNKGLEQSLKKELTDLQAQYKLYADQVKAHGYALSKDGKNPINFGTSTRDNQALSALARFAQAIKTDTPKAHAAAELMMTSLISTINQYPAAIAKAHLEGNKAQEAALKKKYANLKDQLALEKRLIEEQGYKYTPKSAQGPIDFDRSVFLGSSTRASNTSSEGSGSSANGGLIINNTITINATNTNAKELYKMLVDQLSRDLRRSGNLNTWTSGGKA